MAGGYNTPRVQRRNLSLEQRHNNTQPPDKPGECWIIPDDGQLVRATILNRTHQPDGSWTYTLSVVPPA